LEFKENECLKIVKKLKENSEYEQMLNPIIRNPKEIENVLAYPETILDENFIKILKFEIENPETIKVHDQKCFIFSYKLSNKIRFENSKFYLDLKFPQNKFCILGEIRFSINTFSEEELVMEGRLVILEMI
jgi:hypothetical protein